MYFETNKELKNYFNQDIPTTFDKTGNFIEKKKQNQLLDQKHFTEAISHQDYFELALPSYLVPAWSAPCCSATIGMSWASGEKREISHDEI